MRCQAEVECTQMLRYRASGSSDPGCQRPGKYEVRGKHYCQPHAQRIKRLYEVHDRIVARIRAIPCGEPL